MKFLLLVAFLGVVWWIWQKRGRRPQQPPLPPVPERMVTCQHCQLVFPLSESHSDGEVHYCCAEHRRAGPLRGK